MLHLLFIYWRIPACETWFSDFSFPNCLFLILQSLDLRQLMVVGTFIFEAEIDIAIIGNRSR